MQANSKSQTTAPPSGFSLAEVLVVIGVLGVLAAVALAIWGDPVHEVVVEARDRRNAQEVVSLTLAAQAAGVRVVHPGDTRATIQELQTGHQADRGAFAGTIFRLTGLREEEVAGAMKHLAWKEEELIYLTEEVPATPAQ